LNHSAALSIGYYLLSCKYKIFIIKNAIENNDLRDKLAKDAQLAMTDPHFVGIEITDLEM